MSARRIQGGSLQDEVTLQARETRLTLSQDSVVLSPNGIEFRSLSPYVRWTELTLALQPAGGEGKISCSGVVVACSGNKHTGYHVSVLFTALSKQAQSRINQIAATQTA